MENELSKTDQPCTLQSVRRSYPKTGDRVQLINTIGEDNLKYGIVIKHGEIKLDDGSRALIPDWEYQLRLV